MKTVLKLFTCWIAFVIGLPITGIAIKVLHLQHGKMPGNTPPGTQFIFLLLAGAVLVLGLYPLARRLATTCAVRAVLVGGFIFLVLGINGVVETRTFTSMLDMRIGSSEAFYLVEAILLGATFGLLFGEAGTPAGLARRGPLGWTGRVVAAWLAWPVVYWLFGMCIAPIVLPYYRAGVFTLHIPPPGTILEVQLFRSVVFLAASLPLIALWKGSRRGLWLALGLAHAVVVGIYGLVGATFLPMVLRVTHGAEITCDSFAYAGLLVVLFAAPGAVARTGAKGIDVNDLKPCLSK